MKQSMSTPKQVEMKPSLKLIKGEGRVILDMARDIQISKIRSSWKVIQGGRSL